ncbi:MAG: NAD-dependent epimerase/dehydratase family protein [Coxiellaceae bacterium]|jgi:UDP-2-acetamido-2,6-beta-L-arabino-hexul-4-ose reductase|nr:NAD-dependent epimerase/dehydratase family protein [Coxiellaceae bacterium]
MKILITGSEGFIGKNLFSKLKELPEINIVRLSRKSSIEYLREQVSDGNIEFIFHLAGVNRPTDICKFIDNSDFTRMLCNLIITSEKKIPIVFSSSIQANLDNPYGVSKLESEKILLDYGKKTNALVYIYRLPNVFGKWCRPNYNSVVATFCYNINKGLPIQIHDPNTSIRLVYIDDVVSSFIEILQRRPKNTCCEVKPVYSITVGDLVKQLRYFKENKKIINDDALTRALSTTYNSYNSQLSSI